MKLPANHRDITPMVQLVSPTDPHGSAHVTREQVWIKCDEASGVHGKLQRFCTVHGVEVCEPFLISEEVRHVLEDWKQVCKVVGPWWILWQ